jgi:hypothetical protein
VPNPSGANQLAGSEPLYGAVKKATELQREAPMSGAPIATHAQQAPRRAQKQAQRPARGPQPTPEQVADNTAPAPQPDYQAQLASVWQQVSSVPGASPLVAEYAQEAQRQTGGP